MSSVLGPCTVVRQYQTEIPCQAIHRQFDIHVGECRDCGRTVQPRHELQTSNAVGAAKSQLGPRAHAAIAVLNKELGLSYGKVAKLFRELFGIRFARASGARSMARTARRGARTQAVLTSLLTTLRLRGHDAIAWLSRMLTSPTPVALPA